MKKILVGVLAAVIMGCGFAQPVSQVKIESLAMVCGADIQSFETVKKKTGVTLQKSVLVDTLNRGGLVMELYTNEKTKGALIVGWLGPRQLCLVGAGGIVDRKALDEAIERRAAGPQL